MRAKACVKAFLLACLAFSAHAAEYTGYLKSLIVDNGEGASEERLYYLEHVSKGTWLRLQLASELEDRFSTIRTGADKKALNYGEPRGGKLLEDARGASSPRVVG